MSFSSILCPVDLSTSSRAAVQAAAVMAEQFDARLTVLFVDDPLLSRAALRFDEDQLAKRTRTELTRFVERAIALANGAHMKSWTASRPSKWSRRRAACRPTSS